jgi:hypothetical protein
VGGAGAECVQCFGGMACGVSEDGLLVHVSLKGRVYESMD